MYSRKHKIFFVFKRMSVKPLPLIMFHDLRMYEVHDKASW
jgi:hypothetical protein